MAPIKTILTAAALAMSFAGLPAQAAAQDGVAAGSNAALQTSTQASGGTSASAKQGEFGAGTTLNAELSQSMDSKKAKHGDTVTARTTEAVKADGKVVIPKGTKLIGHVTRASARGNGDADSVLAVQFDRAILKDGREMPMQMTIQALAAAQSTVAVGGDDLQPMGNIEGGAAGAGTAGSRGVVGGVGSTVGGAASGAASTVPRATQNTTGAASGAVNSTVGGAADATGRTGGAMPGTGLNAAGELTSTSRGVFGLNGVSLNTNAANTTEGSVISSAGKNVHLDSGTRILLMTQAATAASAQR